MHTRSLARSLARSSKCKYCLPVPTTYLTLHARTAINRHMQRC